MVWLNSIAIGTPVSARSDPAPSPLHNPPEAPGDHALAVERHRVPVWLHARIGHNLLPGRFARLLRGPRDPREHHRLVVLALHGHRERRHFALRHVIAPAFDHLQRTVLPEN